MIIRKKKKTAEEETSKSGDIADVEKIKKSRKKSKNEGSRWTALVLLIVTLVFGFWFYFVGSGGWRGISEQFNGGGMSSTYVFE